MTTIITNFNETIRYNYVKLNYIAVHLHEDFVQMISLWLLENSEDQT